MCRRPQRDRVVLGTFGAASIRIPGGNYGIIAVKLPWIFPGAPLKINGAPGNIQGNLTAMHADVGPTSAQCRPGKICYLGFNEWVIACRATFTMCGDSQGGLGFQVCGVGSMGVGQGEHLSPTLFKSKICPGGNHRQTDKVVMAYNFLPRMVRSSQSKLLLLMIFYWFYSFYHVDIVFWSSE